MEAIGAISGLITVVEVSVRITAICLKYSKGVKNADADIQRLQKTIQHLRHTSESVLELLRGPDQWRLRASQKLLQATEDSEERLKSLEEKLQPSSTRGKFMRLGLSSFKWPFEKKDTERLVTELSQCSQAISAALQVDQLEISLQTSHDISKIDRTIQEMDKRTLLDRLPVVHGAAFNSQAEEHNALCLPETRVDNIHQILEWVSDPQSPSLFWLKGMAGTGKSTISRTIAHSLDARGMLGASFFFNRVEGDRSGISKLFATLAFQLSIHDGQIAKQLISVLEKDPSIPTKISKDQFEKMILEPLRLSYPPDSKTVIVIILDALDECSNHNDARNVINLFSKARVFGIRLRVLITSRPELLLRLGFNEANCDYQSMDLSDTPEITVQQDIARYFETELARIRTEYNARVANDRRLTEDWPGERHAQDLIEMAIPLFIFAATVCRFLAEIRWEPDEQLVKVLNYQSQSPVSKLDATYAPVLNQLIDGLEESETADVISDFQQIVGVIIILEDSLSTSVLSQLLDIPRRKIDRCLDMLHSVLSVPASSTLPVRLLHASFRDYLLDPKMKDTNRFWIDKAAAHRTLANRCLEKMNSTLQEDMCELRVPGTLRKSVDWAHIESHIEPVLQYSCRYWVVHVIESAPDQNILVKVYEFFVAHFLHWLEALSLLGELPDGSSAIHSLKENVTTVKHSDLTAFLSDASQFTRHFYETIDIAPLQLYSSALIFSPQTSLVRKSNDIPKWITLPPIMDQDWDPYVLMLGGHKHPANMAIMSPDSELIAACTSGGEIWIWNADHGTFKTILKGHTGKVQSIAFTADSAHLASYGSDATVRYWDVQNSVCIRIHNYPISRTLASPHPVVVLQQDIVVARCRHENGTYHVWRVDNGKVLHIIETEGQEIVMINNSSSLYATMTSERSLELHEMDKPDLRRIFTVEQPITNGAISPDSSLIAIVLGSCVQVWKVNPDTLYQILDGQKEEIFKIAFSPDSKLLVTGGGRGTIQVWRIETGECIRTLWNSDHLTKSLEFSKDSSLIIAATDDQVIRTWESYIHSNRAASPDLRLWTMVKCVNHHQGLVVACSATQYIHSGLYSSVRIWSMSDGRLAREISIEGDSVISAAASEADIDNLLIAVAYSSQCIRLWSASSGECTHLIQCQDKIHDIGISDDSKTVACSFGGNRIELHNIATGHWFRKLDVNESYFRMVFRTNNKLLCTVRVGVDHIVDIDSGNIDIEYQDVRKLDIRFHEDSRWMTWRGQKLLHMPLSYFWNTRSLFTRSNGDNVTILLPCNENAGLLLLGLSDGQLIALHEEAKLSEDSQDNKL